MSEAPERSLFATPRHVESIEECYFYHTMELPNLGVQHGHWDLRNRFRDYTGAVDVAGKSVLDIGTATGFLSFEAERFGATHVVSFDMSDVRQQIFVPFKGRPYREDYESWIESYSKTI